MIRFTFWQPDLRKWVRLIKKKYGTLEPWLRNNRWACLITRSKGQICGIDFISSTLDTVLDNKIYHVSSTRMSSRMGIDPTWEGGYIYWMVCCKLWTHPLSFDFWVYYLGLRWVLESWEENFNWEFTIKTDFLLFIEVVFFWLFWGFLGELQWNLNSW